MIDVLNCNPMITQTFVNFTVHSDDKKYVFIDTNITDKTQLFNSLFEYFFEDAKLLRYVNNQTPANLPTTLTRQQKKEIFGAIRGLIDEENEIHISKDDIIDIVDAIKAEFISTESNNEMTIRLDKIGKIGEYIFSNLLYDYFKFDCIIPKAVLTTNRNMSVYGIDTLFYKQENNMILFGESKMSKCIETGIALINKSLKTYEKTIKEEFYCVLSKPFLLKQNCINLPAELVDELGCCLSIEAFIQNCNIINIGIPLFIGHGTETDTNTIINKLNSISKSTILGLCPTFYIISLPFVDKDELTRFFTNKLALMELTYAR